MDKIQNLLNERNKNLGENKFQIKGGNYYKIFSKEEGFVQWLVENDKIDIEKVENQEYYLIDWEYYKLIGMLTPNEHLEDIENVILMLCSVQNDPISFLNSILK